MTQMLTSFYVRFADGVQVPQGFEAKRLYPVFMGDVIDDEHTRFLLANRSNEFVWVDLSLLRRVPPPKKDQQNQIA